MVDAIYGKKTGSTQVFDEKGNSISVTAIEAEPCVIVQVKDGKKDGYNAVKVGFGDTKAEKLTKPENGIFKKAKLEPKRYLKEIRTDDSDKEYKTGDTIDISVFKTGDKIRISGFSKGKGFSGVIKRHNFHRGRMTHGSHNHRIPGAIGMCATPSRVHKGKKMPGRMGNRKVTIPRSEVVDVVADQNIILVKGSVPGSKGNIVFIEKI
jgi:large subunit ribosomal protein L3